MRALSLDEVAAELGRSPAWLRAHWERLCLGQKLPRPIHEMGTLVWSAPGFYAWLDRGLSKEQRAVAAAYRAAFDAAGDLAGPDRARLADARARLDSRFVRPDQVTG